MVPIKRFPGSWTRDELTGDRVGKRKQLGERPSSRCFPILKLMSGEAEDVSVQLFLFLRGNKSSDCYLCADT